MRDEIAFIKAGWLIDGSGAAIQKDVQLTIENGMIRSIQKMAVPEAGRETTAGHFMDLSECTVLPGLIDCHARLAMRSTTLRNNRPGLPTARVHAVCDRIVENLEQYLAVGVLAVRDGGDSDAGSTGVEHGKAVIREMRLLIDAGGSIEKVVQYASHNSALPLGLQGVGLLGKNMQATLIAVQGDPSHLPESLKQISLILIKGKQINSNNKIIK